MSHQDHDLLSRALRDRAAGIGEGSPLDLDSVQARARGIRRRRNALRGAVAAVVASLAVPGGLFVTTALQDGDPRPDNNIATGTPSPSIAEERRLEGPTALTLDDLPRGEDPAVPYVVAEPGSDKVYIGTADGRIQIDDALGPVQAAVEVQDGWLVSAYPGPQLHRLDEEGQLVATEQYQAGDRIALAHDRSAVLYVLIDPSDGAQLLTLAPTSGRGEPVNWRLPAGPLVTPVGLVDEDTVIFETEDRRGTTIQVADVGGSPRLLDVDWVGAAAAGDGIVYGVSSVNEMEPSVCSAALRVSTGRVLWENCDYSLTQGALSPNGGLLLANAGYVDGYGATSVSVLDASTGRPLVDYERRDGEEPVTHFASVWEDDRTFISSLASGERFGLVRHGVQGGSELAVDIVRGTPFEDMPFWLTP